MNQNLGLKPNSWKYTLVEVSGHNLEFSGLRFPHTMFTLQTNFHFFSRGGGGRGSKISRGDCE
jgi:hypothetical protein